MSEQIIALLITIAVLATLVFWVPAICLLARYTRRPRNTARAAKHESMSVPL